MRHILPGFLRESTTRRPLWQRVLLPIIGGILMIAGIIGCIFPIIPGIPLLLVGFPLVFCFNVHWERRSRAWMRWSREWIKARFHRKH